MNILSVFLKHKVAANILMLSMLLVGVFALNNLNTQFFPTFDLESITIRVAWPGANAEDVESALTLPLEQELKNVYNLHEMTSISSDGLSQINLEFEEHSDMGLALDEVKLAVSLVRNLPQDAEEPQISQVIRYENIAKLLVTGPNNLEQLRSLVYRFKQELLDAGIAKITLNGLPEEEMAIQIATETLYDLGLSLPQIGQTIRQLSQDIPAGTVGDQQFTHSLRATEQKRQAQSFNELSIKTPLQEKPLFLNEIAQIEQRSQKNEVGIFYQGKPTVQLNLLRTEATDSLDSAKILEHWLAHTLPTLDPHIQLHVFDESWKPIKERIGLLLKNGFTGLLLILLILFIFLEKRIAFWVSCGIPISFFAALALLWAMGGSINMISLFGLIMTIGIIVDDTIVVGEHTYTKIQKGINPLIACEQGAYQMLAPVLASSLTTVFAFLPLLLLGGTIGNILFDIPFVVICVLMASIVECFFVLPGHLYHSFANSSFSLSWPQFSQFKAKINDRFNHFKEHRFQTLVRQAIQYPFITLMMSGALLFLAISLIIGQRVGFNFFPSPDGTIIQAHIQFISGTPKQQVTRFVHHALDTLKATERHFSERTTDPLVITSVAYQNQGADSRQLPTKGNHVASIVVELVSPDEREITNGEFIAYWKKNTILAPGIEQFSISARRSGPPGKDLDIRLVGSDPQVLKKASVRLQATLSQIPGVFNVQDNLPFGKPQLIFELSTQGEALGLTPQDVGAQLRAGFEGYLVQIYNEGEDEIEVRVTLPDEQREDLSTLAFFPILTPQGSLLPLNTVADFSVKQGLDFIRHHESRVAVSVSGEIDPLQNNAQRILNELKERFLDELAHQYGVEYELAGRSQTQQETFSDMKQGALLAIILIYLVLCWVFSSYIWPLAVLFIVPFGITGALFGHALMGIDLTILSFFGFFGLSGIVINDSIILVTTYRGLKESGMKTTDALIEASTLRFRAVLLTSITTIAGLLPLLFEGSLQAQFLIPMATTISFGLLFATLWVLILVPALLALLEHIGAYIQNKREQFSSF